eukprot:1014581_1
MNKLFLVSMLMFICVVRSIQCTTRADCTECWCGDSESPICLRAKKVCACYGQREREIVGCGSRSSALAEDVAKHDDTALLSLNNISNTNSISLLIIGAICGAVIISCISLVSYYCCLRKNQSENWKNVEFESDESDNGDVEQEQSELVQLKNQ